MRYCGYEGVELSADAASLSRKTCARFARLRSSATGSCEFGLSSACRMACALGAPNVTTNVSRASASTESDNVSRRAGGFGESETASANELVFDSSR